MKLFYDAWYRFGNPPWVGGPRSELVELVSSGRLTPGRALDLGCGEGDNAIFLAQHGFTVTALDFAPSAIAKARRKARTAGAEVEFLVDDLTELRHVNGQFDLLVDYGTLDDLGGRHRDAYIREVLPLAAPESQFLLWCFEWDLRRWERIVTSILPFGNLALAPGEAERRFGRFFEVERVAAESDLPTWPRGWAAYLMRRKIGSAANVDASGTSA
ncbi:MAG: class I SAM-dependent methyltransferase [Chloroflexota bacterium]